MAKLGLELNVPTKILCGSTASTSWVSSKSTENAKHINFEHHFVLHESDGVYLVVNYVDTDEHEAKGFTKSPGQQELYAFSDHIGV